MRGDPGSMRVLRPRKVQDALALYAEYPGAVALAGGTDFMVAWNAGGENGRVVVDLSALASWRAIREVSGALRIGALATHWEIQQDPRVKRRLPLLAAACATIGGRQIQSRGTLGGNIANASPAGDTFPPLAVYDATVRLRSKAGARTVPLGKVFDGVKRTALEPGELIESVSIERPRRPARQLFRKVGTRRASAISKVVAAGLLWLRRDGRVDTVRFALGSVAPTVRRLSAAESFLAGEKLTAAVIDEAVSRVEQDIAPIDDLRSTGRYRLQVARNLLRAFLSAR